MILKDDTWGGLLWRVVPPFICDTGCCIVCPEMYFCTNRQFIMAHQYCFLLIWQHCFNPTLVALFRFLTFFLFIFIFLPFNFFRCPPPTPHPPLGKHISKYTTVLINKFIFKVSPSWISAVDLPDVFHTSTSTFFFFFFFWLEWFPGGLWSWRPCCRYLFIYLVTIHSCFSN